jgi:hypothetical protein
MDIDRHAPAVVEVERIIRAPLAARSASARRSTGKPRA